MQNVEHNDYVERLETLIIERLLPGYLQHCKTNCLTPALDELPEQIARRAELLQRLPALLRPF